MSLSSHSTSRLTGDDLARIAQAIAEAHPNIDLTTLRRVCAASIGCASYDLRDSEVDVIDALLAEARPKLFA